MSRCPDCGCRDCICNAANRNAEDNNNALWNVATILEEILEELKVIKENVKKCVPPEVLMHEQQLANFIKEKEKEEDGEN